MSTFAVVARSGTIVNRIVLDDAVMTWPEDGETLVEDLSQVFDIGGTFIDEVYSPPVRAVVPPLSIVPASISDRQFFQQLAIAGTITQAEALAAVKVGTIPPALQSFIDGISDPTQKFAANMLLAGATIFARAHPMTEAIGEAQGMTPAQIDDFFTSAAAL